MNLVDENTKMLLQKRQYLWDEYHNAHNYTSQLKQVFSPQNGGNLKELPSPVVNLPNTVSEHIDLLSKNKVAIQGELQTITQYENEIQSCRNEIGELEGKIRTFYIVAGVAAIIILILIVSIL